MMIEGCETVRVEDVEALLFEHVSVDDVQKIEQNELTEEVKRGDDSESEQRERCCRSKLRVEIGIDEDKLPDLTQQQMKPHSFYLNDLSIDKAHGAQRAKRSVDLRNAVPSKLFGDSELLRCIVSSFMRPFDIDKFFRNELLAWDLENKIPLLIFGHGELNSNDKDKDEALNRFKRGQKYPTCVVFPKLRPTENTTSTKRQGYQGCVHPKIIVAEYIHGIRICISSANMHEEHFFETLETWYIQDFPKNKNIQRAPSPFATDFMIFMGHMAKDLEDMICSDNKTIADWLTALAYCDNESNAHLIMSMPGTNWCFEDDVIGLDRSKMLGFLRVFGEFDTQLANMPMSYDKAIKKNLRIVSFREKEQVLVQLDNAVINLPQTLSTDLYACQKIVTVQAERAWKVKSKSTEKFYVIIRLGLFWTETAQLELPSEAARAAFLRILTKITIPLGFRGLRTKLYGPDWFRYYANNYEQIFYGYSPSTPESRADELAKNIAWASHIAPQRIDRQYNYRDQKGWNHKRLPALLSYPEHVVQSTKEAFECYEFAPPNGDIAGRNRKICANKNNYLDCHAKWLYRVFEKDGRSFGWIYIGSHNLSNAAWGTGNEWGSAFMLNWELGLLFIESLETDAPDGIPPFHRRFPLPFIPGKPFQKDNLETRKTSREVKKDNEDRMNRLLLYNGHKKSKYAKKEAINRSIILSGAHHKTRNFSTSSKTDPIVIDSVDFGGQGQFSEMLDPDLQSAIELSLTTSRTISFPISFPPSSKTEPIDLIDSSDDDDDRGASDPIYIDTHVNRRTDSPFSSSNSKTNPILIDSDDDEPDKKRPGNCTNLEAAFRTKKQRC